MKDLQKAQSGQIFLLVILIMAVVSTIALSVITRSVTNIRTTTDEENSERAFSAAEAGIERALATNLAANQTVSGSFTTSNGASYQTTASSLSGLAFLLNNGVPILKDDVQDVWLTDYPNYTTPWGGSRLTFYWGMSQDDCEPVPENNTQAAIEIILLAGTKASPTITRYAVDPCVDRRSGNKFTAPDSGSGVVSGYTFANKKTINVSSGLMVRVIPLYASALIGVKGCASGVGDVTSLCTPIPPQGTVFESVGTSDVTKRKIISFRGYPKIPRELFPFIIFSPK